MCCAFLLALSLRDSVPVQETGEHSQSLPLEHDEQSEVSIIILAF